ATTASVHADCPLCDATNSDNFQCGLFGAVQPGCVLGTGAHASVCPRCCARTDSAGMRPSAIRETITKDFRYRIASGSLNKDRNPATISCFRVRRYLESLQIMSSTNLSRRSFLAAAAALASTRLGANPLAETPSMKEAYKNAFLIGTALDFRKPD